MEKPSKIKAEDPFKDLTKLQNTTRKAAIIVALIGVFVWFLKVMFF